MREEADGTEPFGEEQAERTKEELNMLWRKLVILNRAEVGIGVALMENMAKRPTVLRNGNG
jgi:hypothetical protein